MNRTTTLLATVFLGLLSCHTGGAVTTESQPQRFRRPEQPDDRREAFDLWALAAPDGRLRVSPMRQWSRTGLMIREGQRLAFAAEGQVKGCQGPKGDWAYGPFGPAGCPSDIDPARACALIARIVGAGKPHEFIVGEKLELAVPFDGRLDLGVSDVWHFDNSGEFVVAVTLDGKPIDFIPLQGPSPVAVPERLLPASSTAATSPTPASASAR
jgi:hypothetical protein